QQLHVSVVIVNWNAGEALLDCIASVERQRKCAGRSFLIDTILVDNDSADNSVALVRDAFPNVKVICAGENLGFARANNLAFEQIQSEFVLLLNPDAVLADDAVAKMLDVALADSRIGIVGCKILNPDGTTEELGIQSFPIPLTEFISMLFG